MITRIPATPIVMPIIAPGESGCDADRGTIFEGVLGDVEDDVVKVVEDVVAVDTDISAERLKLHLAVVSLRRKKQQESASD